MTVLCERLGLKPTETTHLAFVEKFSQLQADKLSRQQEMHGQFLLSEEVTKAGAKIRKLKN